MAETNAERDNAKRETRQWGEDISCRIELWSHLATYLELDAPWRARGILIDIRDHRVDDPSAVTLRVAFAN